MLYYQWTPYGLQLVEGGAAQSTHALPFGVTTAASPPATAPPPTPSPSLLTNSRFIQGALVGAAAAYLLSNESVQQIAIKSMVHTWTAVQGGVEELKERFRDAEAELRAAPSSGED